MLIFPVVPCSRPHAARTIASFTATHTISSIPLALIASAFCTKLGRCFSEQVRVNAPGTAKSTTLLPAKRSDADSCTRRPAFIQGKQLGVWNRVPLLNTHGVFSLSERTETASRIDHGHQYLK